MGQLPSLISGTKDPLTPPPRQRSAAPVQPWWLHARECTHPPVLQTNIKASSAPPKILSELCHCELRQYATVTTQNMLNFQDMIVCWGKMIVM